MDTPQTHRSLIGKRCATARAQSLAWPRSQALPRLGNTAKWIVSRWRTFWSLANGGNGRVPICCGLAAHDMLNGRNPPAEAGKQSSESGGNIQGQPFGLKLRDEYVHATSGWNQGGRRPNRLQPLSLGPIRTGSIQAYLSES